MKNRFEVIRSVAKRELNLVRNDINIIAIILLAPLFYAFFLGTIFQNKIEHDVPVIVVDEDGSVQSRDFIRRVDATQIISVQDVVTDFEIAKEKIYSTDAFGIVFIPRDYETSLKAGRGSTVKLYLNTCRFLVSNDINKAVNEVTFSIGKDVRLRYFEMRGYGFDQAKEIVEPLRDNLYLLFNPIESYGDFLLPAVLVLILQQTLLFGLAGSVAREREEQTLAQLWQLSDRDATALIIGKGMYYFFLFAAYALFFYVVTYSVLGIRFNGNALAMVLLTLLFLVTVIFYTFIIASFFKSKLVSIQFLTVTSYPIFLLSGISWPMVAMPMPMQMLAQFLPSTPYMNAVVRITQMGAGWQHIYGELIHIIVLLTAGFLLAKWRMKSLLSKLSQVTG
jgi:ABC-2 type transport system permease protein